MEEIPYRNTKLLLQTIPKGTLLFRLVKRPLDDTRGVLLDDGTRCIIPNYNVFFYPNPFAVKLALGKWLKDEHKGDYMHIYTLIHDIKVLKLIKPSKYSRGHKGTKRNFIKTCSAVPKGCMPQSLSTYDPCLSDTIISKYPEVVGIMGIPASDSRDLRKSLKKTSKRIKNFFKMTEDSAGNKGIPELVLHPLVKRPSQQIIVKDTDILENNYKLLTKIDINNEAKLLKFMDQHAVYNPVTFYYNYTE
uniref:Uncharacterized protein n=1 Tax=viral metagenome TaxID=1070528 RepID=A0A6C0JL24_9ZZZZ